MSVAGPSHHRHHHQRRHHHHHHHCLAQNEYAYCVFWRTVSTLPMYVCVYVLYTCAESGDRSARLVLSTSTETGEGSLNDVCVCVMNAKRLHGG